MGKKVKDFSRVQMARIAREYAYSEPKYSHSYFEREYSISESTFYTILEKAVIESMIEIGIVIKMAEKLQQNSVAKVGTQATVRAQHAYYHRILKRKTYMLSKKEAISFTEDYADSKLDKKEFCTKRCITARLLDRTIYKAVQENWVSDEIVKKLKRKSLKKNSNQNVLEFWARLESFRNKNKQG